MKDWNIEQIKALTEAEAQNMAHETMEIKGHNIYFVDFGGYFGYSMLVFAEGRHIYYANDYELHHRSTAWYEGMKGEKLREWYIDKANNSLFTDAELVAPIASYDEYRQKSEYLHNLYAQRREYISIFFIGSEAERAERRKQTENMVYDPVGFCYIDDPDFVAHHVELYEALEAQKEKLTNNFDYYKAAFKREMYNHEYAINYQADYDTISAFANVDNVKEYTDADKLMEAAGFTETQIEAYYAARREYYEEQREAV